MRFGWSVLLVVGLLWMVPACGESTPPPAGGGTSMVGDDCTKDSDCASGLCDTNNSCAAVVATTDGNPCVDDSTCPAGDHCDVSSGDCFSTVADGTGGGRAPCTTSADCNGDETCDSTGHCAG
jgi:hypothetical protein